MFRQACMTSNNVRVALNLGRRKSVCVAPPVFRNLGQFSVGKAVTQCRAVSSSVEEKGIPSVKDTIKFLKEDLTHLFDEQGIDMSRYDEVVDFQDPITNYSSLQGYLFNIKMLKNVFAPTYDMHDIKQTGDYEITTRWTMTMQFTWNKNLPFRQIWDPKLVFTGVSIYGINPENGKINRHIDMWDAIDNQQFFSMEAFLHVLRQIASVTQTPDLETPDFTVLKKTKVYEIRKYDPFIVVETELDAGKGLDVNPAGEGSGAFNRLAGYIFGKNEDETKMEMTTPVFTSSEGRMQFVIGSKFKDVSSLPTPSTYGVDRKEASGGLYAVSSFNGLALEDQVDSEYNKLKKALLVDGIRPAKSWILARYNDPFTNPVLRRNEILIPIDEGFSLW